MRERLYYVYILTNRSGTLYVGVTSNLERRLWEHGTKRFSGFTSKYNLSRLVYYEYGRDVRWAIAREKQIKRWRREKKVALIESVNRNWKDLSDKWNADAAPKGEQQQTSTARSLHSGPAAPRSR